MANEQNLVKPFDSERGREMQKKSVEARYKNTIKRRLIEDAIRKELTDEDLREIARGIIKRSKNNTYDLIAMRDTLGEKPKEVIEHQGEISNPYSNLTEEELRKLAQDESSS